MYQRNCVLILIISLPLHVPFLFALSCIATNSPSLSASDDLHEQREAENALLDAEYTSLHSEIQPIKEKLQKQQKSIQTVYDTIHASK